MRNWKPRKIFRKPEGGDVLFTQNVNSRELRKEPFPVLQKFPDICRQDLPVYRENPKYLTYFSHREGGTVARRPQVADVVHVQGLRTGECVEESTPRDETITVETRDRGAESWSVYDLTVLHHNIERMGKGDPQNLLDDCTRNYRTVEELEYAESLCEGRARDWSLDRASYLTVDVSLVKKLHQKLMGSLFPWAGEFRAVKLWVGPDNFSTTDPRFIPDRMETFEENLAQYTSELHDLDETNRRFWWVLARIYLELCEIHPFRDGNGRVSRLLITVLLAKFARSPAPLRWDSLKRPTSKTNYAFVRAREKDDLTPLARLICRAYRKSATELEIDARRWSDLNGGYWSPDALEDGFL